MVDSNKGLGLGAAPVNAASFSGILATANGGTGINTSGASNGQLLIGNGSGLSLAALTAGSGLSVTNGSGAITIQTKSILLSSDCSVHAVTTGTSETVLKAHSVAVANFPVMTANAVIKVRTLWTITNSSNNKTLRVRIGAAGAGTGGTLLYSGALTTIATAARDLYIYVRGTSSQLTAPTGFGVHEATGTGAVATSAIDLTANWEIAVTGQTASSGETITLEASSVELLLP